MNNLEKLHKISLLWLFVCLFFFCFLFIVPSSSFLKADDSSVTVENIKPGGELEDDESSVTVENIKPGGKLEANDGPLIFLLIICILSMILAITSSLIAFWLYRWRTFLIDNQNFLVPENLIIEYQRQNQKLDELSRSISNSTKFFEEGMRTIGGVIENTNQNLLIFQEKINEKDKEIQRYREGFDLKIYKAFLNRYFRVFQLIEKLSNQEKISQSEIQKIQEVFIDAFEESGVELFYPEEGEDYLESNFMFEDNAKVILTNEPQHHNKVAKVLRPALRTTDTDKKQIIIRSKVTIFNYQGE